MRDAQHTNVAMSFDATVATVAEQTALQFPEVSYSYRQLHQLTAAFAIKFRTAGLTTSSVVRLDDDDPQIVVPTLLACALIGCSIYIDEPSVEAGGQIDFSHTIGRLARRRKTQSIVIDETYSPANFDPKELNRIWADCSERDGSAPWLVFPSKFISPECATVGLSQSTVQVRCLSCIQASIAKTRRFALLWPVQSYGFVIRALAAILNGDTLVCGQGWSSWSAAAVSDVSIPTEDISDVLELNDSKCVGLAIELTVTADDAWEKLPSPANFASVQANLEFPETGIVYSESRSPATYAECLTYQFPQGEGSLKVQYSGTGHHAQSFGHLVAKLPSSENDNYEFTGIAARLKENGSLEILGREHSAIVQGVAIDLIQVDRILCGVSGIEDAVIFVNPKVGTDELIGFAVFSESVNRVQAFELGRHLIQRQICDAAAPVRLRPIDTVPRGKDGLPMRNTCQELVAHAVAKQFVTHPN